MSIKFLFEKLSMTDIVLIAGARPNFMKIAPILRAVDAYNIERKEGKSITYKLVHTGQHYDERMSQLFFNELKIPHPDVNLNCGGGSQAQQTAAIMIAFENYLTKNPAKLVLVVGDVTSTLACSIVAKKLNTRVAHVEAGIRSFDLAMPEEINRMVTDSISDFFFTTSEYANKNLKASGVSEERVFFTGNVMIDTLRQNEDLFAKPDFYDSLGLVSRSYIVLTLHRPSNVDSAEVLESLLTTLDKSSAGAPIIFPVHPRTRIMLERTGLQFPGMHIVDPMGYLNFMYLVKHAKGVVTDSGGITEETTVMDIPCITLRSNTERPETVDLGTNVLVGQELSKIEAALAMLAQGGWKSGSIPPLWDGKAAERIVNHLVHLI